MFFFKPLCYNQLFLLAKKKNWRAPSDACHEIQTVDTKGVELKNADNSLIWLLILVTWQTKLFRNSHVTTTWRAGWIIFKVISLRHLAGNHTYTCMHSPPDILTTLKYQNHSSSKHVWKHTVVGCAEGMLFICLHV